ncbi:MAG: thiamine ABC transporter substrate-binding protein [Candidatus Acetothermia bacterium]|jgi:thiamine transport system substrate-binding protein|nr:thiamine ABC transporter substrate-binding protein [Candidatus Acetothermia bacterium]MDH7505140.1 thiamine ABC transporter substrate-binding protein [Candidatus Acetothermia bacterium]
MRKVLFAAVALALGLLFSAAAEVPALVVYTYDSFASWGPAAFIEEEFERDHAVDVQFIATADSRAMLVKLIREREAGEQGADVFIGVEAADLARAKASDLFIPLTAEDVPTLTKVPEALLIDPEMMLIPYEHGYITLVYDGEALQTSDVPRTFPELLDSRYRRMLILEDPRLSSPGLSFLLWTIHQFGDPGYLDYWRELLPNILTIAGGWSEAYELFLAGEGPIVLSFSTDTAYSVIETGSARYKVMLLNNQGYRNIYLMGVVRGTRQERLAKEFLDFVLSPAVQERIPLTEWMFPANPEALLPVEFYQYAVVPPQPVMLSPEEVGQNLDRWLREWASVIVGG